MNLTEKIQQVLNEGKEIQDISGADEGKKAEEKLSQTGYPGNLGSGDKAPKKLEGADPEELDSKDLGKSAEAKEKQTTPLKGQGADETTLYKNTSAQVAYESIDLTPIFGETELSEEFKEKATGLFEASVIARVNHEVAQIEAELQESYEAQLDEATQELQLEMSASIDSYLTNFATKWIEENQIAIDNGLRTEIAESFMAKLHKVFLESYIEVPESKIDIVESTLQEKEDLEVMIGEAAETIAILESQVEQFKKQEVFAELSESMTAVEVSKLKQLSEGVEYQDYDTFKSKLNVIKESYFAKPKSASPEKLLVEDALDNSFKNQVAKAYVDPAVAQIQQYLANNK